MMLSYQTVSGESTGEYTEKRSRFIGSLVHVSSEEEALAFIEEKRKKYWDARHNCYAYILAGGEGLSRFSDDGEPSGTAGKPMLEVLKGANLADVCLVVTRYFGGTLLGTGGLVRAYTAAAEEAAAAAVRITMARGMRLIIRAEYTDAGKLQYLFAKEEAKVLFSDYTDRVAYTLIVPTERKNALVKAAVEATAGRAVITEEEEEYYSPDA